MLKFQVMRIEEKFEREEEVSSENQTMMFFLGMKCILLHNMSIYYLSPSSR